MLLGAFLQWFLGLVCGLPILLIVGLVAFLFALHVYRHKLGGSPGSWLRARLGRGRSLAGLARLLETDAETLARFQPRYHEFTIPKRNGGFRKIAAPDKATKDLQRKILYRVLARLHSHPAVNGFEILRSIVHNARPHVGQAIVVKLDIEDFFSTTRAARIEAYFRRIGWDATAAACLTRLVCHEGGLPQGAPTSPRVSNLVNYFLDQQCIAYAYRRKGEYTRYADDLTFSFPKDYPRRMRGVEQWVRRILRKHGYELRGDKTRFLRRHQRQIVTGLVVNSGIRLPRETRRRLRAMKHRMARGERTIQPPAVCQGWLALEAMVKELTEEA